MYCRKTDERLDLIFEFQTNGPGTSQIYERIDQARQRSSPQSGGFFPFLNKCIQSWISSSSTSTTYNFPPFLSLSLSLSLYWISILFQRYGSHFLPISETEKMLRNDPFKLNIFGLRRKLLCAIAVLIVLAVGVVLRFSPPPRVVQSISILTSSMGKAI